MKWTTPLVLLLAVFAYTACNDTTTSPNLLEPDGASFNLGDPTYTEDWDGRGSDSERCRVPDADDPRFPLYDAGSGWIHWIFATKGASTHAVLVVNGDSYDPGEPLNANVWHFYTPFEDIDDLEATIYLYGGAPGTGGGLVISDYCPGDGLSLDVRKTAFTEFDREHEWDIDKFVETENEYTVDDDTPKIWLFTDGSGNETATWKVDVTYEGYTDSDFVVYGDIEIENISTTSKVITSITDDLGFPGYDDITVDCGEGFTLPYTIAAGEVLECTYRVEFPDGTVTADDYGTNSVAVLVEDDPNTYGATADWAFGDPETELYKTVNVKDISDLFGEVALGTVTAPYGDLFTYDKDFAYEDYGQPACGSFQYDNTASIVETGQDADAILKVNVQCYEFDSAWAFGEDLGDNAKSFCDNGFNNWGWSNEIPNPYGPANWPLYAGAAQCDIDKGMLVGHFELTYTGGVGGFVYEFVPLAGLDVLFEGEAVYADAGMFPLLRNGSPTTAPGQYYINDGVTGTIHVIAHVNAGIPDPDFGPQE